MAHVNPTFLSTYPLSNTEGNLQIKSCFQELWRTAPWTEKKTSPFAVLKKWQYQNQLFPLQILPLLLMKTHFPLSWSKQQLLMKTICWLKHFKQIVVDHDNLSQLECFVSLIWCSLRHHIGPEGRLITPNSLSYGMLSWPENLAIFCIPVQTGLVKNVPSIWRFCYTP